MQLNDGQAAESRNESARSDTAPSEALDRLAVGAASSQPAAATSEGLAAATKETLSGSCSDPTS